MSESVSRFNMTGWRLWLVCLALLLAAAALLWKLVTLVWVDGEFLQNQGDARTIRTEPIVAHRGMIVDRNGEPLAISTPVESIWVNPRELAKNESDIRALATSLQLNPDSLTESVLANAEREFMYVQRRIPPDQAQAVMALGLDGVYSRQEFQRYYPQGEVTAHVLGFSNIDDIGQEGLELAFDDWLKGVPGRQQVIKDRRGRIIRELNTVEPAQPGKALELSIDFRIQNLAYKELKAEYIYRRARSASAVILDARNGEILAMVNQPSFNPHNRASITDFGALRNRAVTDLFEPGSTLKSFTAVAAIESGLYSRDTMINTSPGRLRVGRDWVEDRGYNYGEISLEEMLVKSSNVGSAKIALAVGHEKLRDVLLRVGFGESPASGFPGERGGVMPNHRIWHDIELATLSFGYGMSTSALQLAQAYAVIANDGMRTPVTILKDGNNNGSGVVPQRVIAEDVVHEVKSMLKAVVDPELGGSDSASVPFYSIAGKTGTARVVGAGGYQANLHNSMFAGFIPADDPRIVVVIIINEPQGGEHYGSQVAAPVFARIASGAMRILEVTPDRLDSSRIMTLTAR
ncbi:peptidoglycan D,D-transpeptidase FtsI family protein [Pseudohongiella spirulinae]|uniref:Peptidoglycan D,D-transpeptidase FtsI n=1 Tax=Pseudohongiella spirulinae TaxID=1249552 RepID=A0A0S2KF45_9GAMM|nr:penicillin-binding protein 2 [Pseudohongiella spirulinae]ALO46936.1 Peptidoglycan glycosyltransferase [Pseudohongiella spirulinae]